MRAAHDFLMLVAGGGCYLATTSFYPKVKNWYLGLFLVDGTALVKTGRQTHPTPSDWIFDGFCDENGVEFDPGRWPDRTFYSEFQAVGYVAGTCDTLPIPVTNIIFHFVLSSIPSFCDTFFERNRHGGVGAKGLFEGYHRQFHVDGSTPGHLLKMLKTCRESGQKIKIRGCVCFCTSPNKKIQESVFQKFDDRIACPVVTIFAVETAE